MLLALSAYFACYFQGASRGLKILEGVRKCSMMEIGVYHVMYFL